MGRWIRKSGIQVHEIRHSGKKRAFKAFVLLFLMASLSGCLYANTTLPLTWVSNTRLDVKDLTLEEKEITGKSKSYSILFNLIGWGNSGLDAALNDAKENAGFKVNEVYDVKIDIKVFTILSLFSSQTTIIKAKVAN